MRPRNTVLLAVLVALLVPAVAGAQEGGELVARVDRPTPVAAHAGWVAWSEREPGTARFRLVVRKDGVTAPVDIAPRGVPFDVDLGPDAQGGVSAVYSRCATEPPGGGLRIPLYLEGRGCEIFRFSFATGREERVTAVSSREGSEAWPTIWRSRLAFARAFDAKRAYPYLYVNDLSRSAPSRRMPGGQRKACRTDRSNDRRTCSDDRRSTLAGLDLYGRRLAFSWRYLGLEAFEHDLRLDDVLARDGDPRRLDTAGGGSQTVIELGWPAFESGRLLWSRACFGDPAGCPGRRALMRSTILGPNLFRERWDPRETVWSHDRDGGLTYQLRDTFGSGGAECRGDPEVEGGTCELVAVRPEFR